MNQLFDNLKDKKEVLLDKVRSPTTRAGNTVERIGKMCKSGVDDEVIALQMTKNSSTNQKYTSQDVKALNKVYQDTMSRVLITKRQAESLIKEQKNENVGLELSPAS